MIRKTEPTDYSKHFDVGDTVSFRRICNKTDLEQEIELVCEKDELSDEPSIKPGLAKPETYLTDSKTHTARVPIMFASMLLNSWFEREFTVAGIDASGSAPVYILSDGVSVLSGIYPTKEFLVRCETGLNDIDAAGVHAPYRTYRVSMDSISVKPALYDPVTKTLTEI